LDHRPRHRHRLAAPAGFGALGGDVLVGNFAFGESEINAFDANTGAFEDTLAIDPGAGSYAPAAAPATERP
jgi:hypothetical protein